MILKMMATIPQWIQILIKRILCLLINVHLQLDPVYITMNMALITSVMCTTMNVSTY